MGSDPNAKTQQLPVIPESTRPMSRQDRVQAASAEAGRWASKALENGSRMGGRTEAQQKERQGKTLDRQHMSMLREAHAQRKGS